MSKLKYADENGGWTDVPPSVMPSLSTPMKGGTTVCSADLKGLDVTEIERFHELLALYTPAVAIIQNVNIATLLRLKSNLFTRKTYAMIESTRREGIDEICVIFVRLGLQCVSKEAELKPNSKVQVYTLIQLNVKGSGVPEMKITVLNMEPSSSRNNRYHETKTILELIESSEVTMLVNNLTQGIRHEEPLYRELHNARVAAGFSDVVDDNQDKSRGYTSH